MDNNNVLQRLRYTFDLSDDQMIEIFGLAEVEVTRAEISDWLKKEDDPEFKKLHDKPLATFLNGFISLKRGKKEGETPKPEKKLTNNLILRKLKIALNLQSEDILAILELSNFKLSKHELSAFFRKPSQNQYRVCKDQVLRNFLMGLQLKHRPKAPKDTKPSENTKSDAEN